MKRDEDWTGLDEEFSEKIKEVVKMDRSLVGYTPGYKRYIIKRWLKRIAKFIALVVAGALLGAVLAIIILEVQYERAFGQYTEQTEDSTIITLTDWDAVLKLKGYRGFRIPDNLPDGFVFSKLVETKKQGRCDLELEYINKDTEEYITITQTSYVKYVTNVSTNYTDFERLDEITLKE